MNCIIPGANMKVISKAIQALSKIGDEIYIKPNKDYLSLESVNMTTTAYCIFHFHEAFFSSYEVIETNASESCSEELLYKVTAKALLGVFKAHGHKDKKPEFCKIELENSTATSIIFKFKYKHDVMATKSLYLSDGRFVNIVYNKDLITNQIGAPASLYTKALSNFQLSDDDVSFDILHTKTIVRNYITGDINSIRGVRSQISITAGEFNTFKIDRETNITFSLKPFRAAIHFAESFNLAVILNFEVAGKPAILIIKNPTFEVNFVMATLKGEDDTQSTLSSAVLRPVSVKPKNNKEDRLNITVQDQEALESISWDNDFDDNSTNTRKKGKFDDIIDKLNKERSKALSTHNLFNKKDSVIPNSPHKRIKSIFGRCYEDTFHSSLVDFGDVLAPDSDQETS